MQFHHKYFLDNSYTRVFNALAYSLAVLLQRFLLNIYIYLCSTFAKYSCNISRDQPTERQVRIQLKDHIDRCKKRKQDNSVREEIYKYSGSEGEEEEQGPGEPSSIVHNAPGQGGDTLRRNFQQIQEGPRLVYCIAHFVQFL